MAMNRNSSETGMGKMFYGIILADHECDLGPIGLNNQRVHSVNYKDIAALVSDHPRVDKIKMLRKYLGPFHFVNRNASEHFATIPARFGQIARDSGEVTIAIQKNYDKIRQALNKLDGKVEMGIRAWWNVENLFDYFIEKDEALRTRKNQLKVKSSVNRMEQIEFGRFFHERMERSRKELTAQIFASLPPVAESRTDDVTEDSMIMNATLLIDKQYMKHLENAVDAFGVNMSDEFKLKLEGPWPPFSFVDRLELHLAVS
jgi:hypothetical protein